MQLGMTLHLRLVCLNEWKLIVGEFDGSSRWDYTEIDDGLANTRRVKSTLHFNNNLVLFR